MASDTSHNQNPIKLNRYKTIFVDENSPDNPFGPNYFKLPYLTKVSYKYSKMKHFIIPEKQDIVRKEDEEAKYIGALMMGMSGGFAIAGAIRMFVDRVIKSKGLGTWLFYNQKIIYPLIALFTTTMVYSEAQDRFSIEIGKHFVDKYLSQAIENGFEDYEISK